MPFFITLNYPYSVKRGEAVTIQVIVFNYLGTDVNATVTFYNDNSEYDFVDEAALTRVNASKTKKIFAKANGGTPLDFLIKPLKSGYILLKCEARANIAGDRVERPLLVIPEGVTEYVNEAVFVDLRTVSSFSQKVNITIPANAVPDSTKIDVTVTGDIMTPMLKSLDNLM
jgi:CD109 antigen